MIVGEPVAMIAVVVAAIARRRRFQLVHAGIPIEPLRRFLLTDRFGLRLACPELRDESAAQKAACWSLAAGIIIVGSTQLSSTFDLGVRMGV
jgi:hypothetical protein